MITNINEYQDAASLERLKRQIEEKMEKLRWRTICFTQIMFLFNSVFCAYNVYEEKWWLAVLEAFFALDMLMMNNMLSNGDYNDRA
jgi:hypothetical protein